MSRKPRPDARLKTLPDERQRAIIELMRAKSLAEVRKELRADGIETSSAALSEFWSWWQLQETLRRAEHTTETLLEELKRDVPAISDQALDELGQRTFSLLAIQNQDADTFLNVRTARFKGEIERAKLQLRQQAESRHASRLALEREKWVQESCRKILAAATDARAKEIAESGVTNEEKIRLLRQTYFADIDELEKSGTVELPA